MLADNGAGRHERGASATRPAADVCPYDRGPQASERPSGCGAA
jgi:hypothetical protein